jgi:hypothetical protein
MDASLRDRASRASHGALSGLRHPATIACAYALIGLGTFGHAAARLDAYQRRFCQTLDDRVKSPGISCYDSPSINGMFSGVLWPFYWSWELQQ